MELGNAVFGNSRGTVPVDRNLQEPFYNYLESMGFDGYGNKLDNDEWVFENEVFRVQPYYWGDCQCGFEARADAWWEKNNHDSGCYSSELERLEKSAGVHWREQDENLSFDERRKIKEGIYQSLTKKHNKPMQGCAVHCTCYVEGDADDWFNSNSHSNTCLVATPNFTFKPTGFTLSWYKYPLRDSYSSDELTLDKIKKMMTACILSLGDPTPKAQ